MKVDFSELRRILVAIDPATTSNEDSDDTGIVVVARGPHQDDSCKIFEATGRCPGHGYVLADLTCHVKPHEWARRAVKAYDRFRADKIIAETNNGGDMVEETLRAIRLGVPYKKVTATRGKTKRAEPVAALWEQGRMHFVSPCPELVDELTTWTQDSEWSPNRLDALVWGMSALGLLGGQGDAFISAWKRDISARKIVHLDEKRAEKRRKEIQRKIEAMPRFGRRPQEDELPEEKPRPTRAQLRCEHRFRGDYCVFCYVAEATLAN